MYWWNVSKLAEDLREGRVTEKERFKYFLATFAAWGLAVQLFLYTGIVLSEENLVSSTIMLALAVLGIGLCYRINKNGDNADFVPRMICLGWPISILVVVVYSAFFLVYEAPMSLGNATLDSQSFLSAFQKYVRGSWSWWAMLCVTFYLTTLGKTLAIVAGAKGAESVYKRRGTDLLQWVGGSIGIVVALGTTLFFIFGYVFDGIMAGLVFHTLLGLGCLLGLGIVLVRLSRSSWRHS